MNAHTCVLQRLRTVIWHSIDNDLLETAEFTAERLIGVAEESDLDAIYLYGLVLLKRGKHKTAFRLTANKLHVGCSYVFAKCALALELEKDGIDALLATMKLWRPHDPDAERPLYDSPEYTSRSIPDASVLCSLLGRLYGAIGDTKQSSVYHTQALRTNPYLWESYEQLCQMGVNVNARNIYRPQAVATSSSSSMLKLAPIPPKSFFKKEVFQTPPDPRRAPAKVSSRLVNQLTPTGKRRKEGLLDARRRECSEQAEFQLMTLYLIFARALKAMSRYDCYKAIRVFNQLPDAQIETPWVLGKLGRLNFEIVNYAQAEDYFIRLRAQDRTRVEDMEYYSTLLWHLQKDVELSYLAHELYEVNKQCPQTWVAIGNLFSLQRETDEAIKCFHRATQVDYKFAYAYTLKGHEYIFSDAYENALESFRNALLHDSKHYNALYGIGMVYMKLGQFQKAEYHFRRASDINPVNVILFCCVGMVLEKQDKKELALKQYQLATELQPTSPLALFKKAQLLYLLQNFEASLMEFEKLKFMAPDEASVHFLLGQLYKTVGRRHEAVKEFTVALNLDPKGSQLIKDALESLSEE